MSEYRPLPVVQRAYCYLVAPVATAARARLAFALAGQPDILVR